MKKLLIPFLFLLCFGALSDQKLKIEKIALVPDAIFRSKLNFRERAGLVLGTDFVLASSSRGWIASISTNEPKIIKRIKTHCKLASPANFDENYVYYACQNGILIKQDLFSSEIIWQFKFFDSTASTPAISEKFVVFQTGSGKIYCLNKSSGELCWLYRTGATGKLSLRGASQPLIDQNRVYVGGREGNLLCFQLESGKLIWKQKILKPSVLSDLDFQLLSDQTTIYASAKTGIAGVSKKSGKVFWTLDEELKTKPSLDLAKIYLLNQSNELLVVDSQVGLILKRIPVERLKKEKPLGVFTRNGKVFILTRQKIFKLIGENLKLIKNYPGKGAVAYLAKDKFYILNSKGYLLTVKLGVEQK